MVLSESAVLFSESAVSAYLSLNSSLWMGVNGSESRLPVDATFCPTKGAAGAEEQVTWIRMEWGSHGLRGALGPPELSLTQTLLRTARKVQPAARVGAAPPHTLPPRV